MNKAFKDNETITIYFGDSIRKLLRKNLRKKNTYFVDYLIVDIEGDVLTVIPNTRPKEDEMPYEVTALRISANDKHILPPGELDKMRDEIGLDLGTLEVLTREVDEEDWANNWKAYFKPIKVGSRLIVCPRA